MNKRGDKGKGSGGGKLEKGGGNLEKGGGAERGKRSERRKNKGEERRCGKRRGGKNGKRQESIIRSRPDFLQGHIACMKNLVWV